MVALLIGWWAIRRDDRSVIQRLLEETAEALRVTPTDPPGARAHRIERQLQRTLSEDAAIDIAGHPEASRSREALIRFAQRTRGAGERAAVVLEHLEVTVQDDTARARGDVLLTESSAADLHSDRRTLELRLVRRGDRWWISELVVGPRTHEAPEARP